jgi:hypothetical protein
LEENPMGRQDYKLYGSDIKESAMQQMFMNY